MSNNVVTAAVTEDNGEISCSIEETNRIRALLGLKPLKVESSDGKKYDQTKAKQEEVKLKEQNEIRERLEKAKSKRLLNEKLQGKTLSSLAYYDDGDGDRDGGDGSNSSILNTADWINRSRLKSLENERKNSVEKATTHNNSSSSSSSSSSSYTSMDLKGLKVMHDAKHFQDGEEVILTLADTRILDVDEVTGLVRGVNDSDDVLQNTHMTEEQMRIDREIQLKRLKRPVYSGIDDEEFDGSFTARTRPVLSQYDRTVKKGPAFTIGDDLDLAVHNDQLMSTKRFKYEDDDSMVIGGRSSSNVSSSSLSVPAPPLSADYYTSAEYAAFAKPKKDSKKRKIRRKIEEYKVEDTTAMMDAIAAQNSVEEPQVLVKDRASRNVKPFSLSNGRDAPVVKREKYTEAVSKAVVVKTEEADEDDDAEIMQSLAKARRLAQLQSKGTTIASDAMDIDGTGNDNSSSRDDTGAIKVRERILSKRTSGVIDSSSSISSSNDTLVFTATTEFTSRLQTRLHDKERERVENSINVSMSNIVKDEDDIDDLKANPDVLNESDMMTLMAVDDDDYEEEEENFTRLQPTGNQGLAASLALLRASGELIKSQQLTGRAKDSKYDPSGEVDKGVSLEYRDDKGRKLTQKEAYRQLCYKFHGYGPSKNKIDRRSKQQDIVNKLTSSKISTDKGIMGSLRTTQAATGKAYVAINQK